MTAEQSENCLCLVGSLGWLDKSMLGRCEVAWQDRELTEAGWRCEVKRLWGSRLQIGRAGCWRSLAEYCETVAAGMLATSNDGVYAALRALCAVGSLETSAVDDDLPTPIDRADCLFAIASRGERNGSWIARRLVASFVTSCVGGTLCAGKARRRSWRRLAGVDGTAEYEHQETLILFAELLAPRLSRASVEDALRTALWFFPFLPAQSSHGADRVIDALASAYVRQRPNGRLLVDPYVVWYSLVLLNTDLHNQRVTAKISEDGFARSLARTDLICDHLDTFARALYRSIKAHPLMACQPGPARPVCDTWPVDFEPERKPASDHPILAMLSQHDSFIASRLLLRAIPSASLVFLLVAAFAALLLKVFVSSESRFFLRFPSQLPPAVIASLALR